MSMIADEQAVALAQRWAPERERPTRLCSCCGGQASNAEPCPYCGISGRDPFAMQAWARRYPSRKPLDDAERDRLFGWLRKRVSDYHDGARAAGYETDPPREDLAEWIGLDLGEPFESGRALTIELIDAALAAEPLPVFEPRAVSPVRLAWSDLLRAEAGR